MPVSNFLLNLFRCSSQNYLQWPSWLRDSKVHKLGRLGKVLLHIHRKKECPELIFLNHWLSLTTLFLYKNLCMCVVVELVVGSHPWLALLFCSSHLRKTPLTMDDFHFVAVLGRGHFGKVNIACPPLSFSQYLSLSTKHLPPSWWMQKHQLVAEWE